jgi:hypothetical protein
VRGPRDVTGDENGVGDHAVDVKGAAAGVAADSPEPGGQAGAVEPFGVANRAQRRHHHIDVQGGAIGEPRVTHMAVGVTVERLDRNPGTQINAGIALHLGRDLADHSAQRADQRRVGALGNSHRKTELATDRRHFRPDEPRSHDQHPLRSGFQRRLQSSRVITAAQREHPFQRAFCWVEPRPRAGTGRDQQPVVGHCAAIGQYDLLVVAVQSGGGHTEAPVGIDGPHAGKLGVIGAHPALEHLLGQRGTVIRFVRLIADQRQTTAKTAIPQCFCSSKPRQRYAHDDDAALDLEGVYQIGHQWVRAHFVVTCSGASTSIRIACTGHDATARNTR